MNYDTVLATIVSILVFVEVALGLLQASNNPRNQPGFNPCFRGSRPRTLELCRSGKDGLVSILVFVEVALGLGEMASFIRGALSFNPCFRGSRPRTKNPSLVRRMTYSFNPCFRGSRPRTAFDIDFISLAT